MKFLRMLAALAASSAMVHAADLSVERIWTGVNGKTFLGTFVKFSPDRQTVDFLTSAGKVVSVSFSNLSAADQLALVPPPPETVPLGDKEKFKPESAVRRTFVPGMVPMGDFSVWGYRTVDVMWFSMLWWDTMGVLEFEKKGGDLPRRAEWLSKKLKGHIVKGAGKDPSEWGACEKGMLAFFEAELKEVAVCRIHRERQDFRLERLCAFARGANAVGLRLCRQSADKSRSHTLAAVESLAEDGTFVIHAYGKRLTGKVTPRDAAAVAFEVSNLQDLPAEIAAGSPKFLLDKTEWGEVFVVKPYVFANKGVSSPPPLDESFPFGGPPAAP